MLVTLQELTMFDLLDSFLAGVLPAATVAPLATAATDTEQHVGQDNAPPPYPNKFWLPTTNSDWPVTPEVGQVDEPTLLTMSR